jgi:hypothetical protein
MDRLNEAARDERWPMRLALHGFEPLPPASAPPERLDPAQAAARLEHWMRFLLKRFVDPQWIDQRLNQSPTAP